MFEISETGLESLGNDADEADIRRILDTLLGKATPPRRRLAELREIAAMAFYHGRRMGLTRADGFDALAALCLVLGPRRCCFFENVFVRRLLADPASSPRQKLARIISLVIKTGGQPEGRAKQDMRIVPGG